MKKKTSKSKPVATVVPSVLPPPVSHESSIPKPDIYADRLAKLSPEERGQLRAILTHPLYVKFLRIVAVKKPSANCTGTGSGERDAFSDARANARLGEIRGWELHEFAIFLALNEPAAVKEATKETFPDEAWIHPRSSDAAVVKTN